MKEVMVGANFTLAAMCDDFVEVILGTLDRVDFSQVLKETDDVSTTVRGRINHVFDVTKAICIYAAQTGQHISFNVKYSTGCQGTEQDREILKTDSQTHNVMTHAKQFAAAKFSMHPVGLANDLDLIQAQVKVIESYAKVSRVPLATKLEGELSDIFNGLEKAFEAMLKAESLQSLMVVNISINSPSHDEREINQ